jgi:hypothetical protein
MAEKTYSPTERINKGLFDGVFIKGRDLEEDKYIDKLEPHFDSEPQYPVVQTDLQKKSVWDGIFDPSTPNTLESIIEEILVENIDESKLN